jgi:hypothetical protein
MGTFLSLVLVAWRVGATAEESDGFVELFNGQDLTGWKVKGDADGHWQVGTASLDPANPRELAVNPTGRELINVRGGGRDLYTEQEFGDAIIELEVLVPQRSNSGIYLMGEYEIQILDSHGRTTLTQGDMGAIYSAAPPSANASRPPGEWQRFQIRYRAPRFDPQGNKTANARVEQVVLNDVVIQQDVEIPGPTGGSLRNREAPRGPLMFQGDHGPVAFRHIRVKPLESP